MMPVAMGYRNGSQQQSEKEDNQPDPPSGSGGKIGRSVRKHVAGFSPGGSRGTCEREGLEFPSARPSRREGRSSPSIREE
jgi:hypothetical protein